MKVGTYTRSTQSPDRFKIEKLLNGAYVVSAAENVETLTFTEVENETPVERVEYAYTAYAATVELSTYEEAVAALVALKYSCADETALMRKGIADNTNEEYVDYVAYVESCKAYARSYYGIVVEGGDV